MAEKSNLKTPTRIHNDESAQGGLMKSLILMLSLFPTIAGAAPPATDHGATWPKAAFEIFKLAPGRQESFIRKLAQWDQVNVAGGQPATQLFIHEEGGGDWDVLLFKPYPKTPITPAQQAAMDAEAARLHLKTGPAFFLEIRQNMASHTETQAIGPVTTADWLARLDAWRAAHPEAARDQGRSQVRPFLHAPSVQKAAGM